MGYLWCVFAPKATVHRNYRLNSWSVLLRNYKQNTNVIVGYTRDWLFRILSNADNDFPVPSLLFQMAHIPPLKGEWGIRLPLWNSIGTRASPARIDTTFIRCGDCPDPSIHVRGKEVDSQRWNFKACADEKTAVYCRTWGFSNQA